MGKDEINAFLGEGTVYEGKLQFQGAVRIDGQFTGEVESQGALVVGKEARVSGTLKVGELLLSGRVEGEVRAAQRMVIHKTGSFVGTVHAPALVMEEGAHLEGEVHMGTPSAERGNT